MFKDLNMVQFWTEHVSWWKRALVFAVLLDWAFVFLGAFMLGRIAILFIFFFIPSIAVAYENLQGAKKRLKEALMENPSPIP